MVERICWSEFRTTMTQALLRGRRTLFSATPAYLLEACWSQSCWPIQMRWVTRTASGSRFTTHLPRPRTFTVFKFPIWARTVSPSISMCTSSRVHILYSAATPTKEPTAASRSTTSMVAPFPSATAATRSSLSLRATWSTPSNMTTAPTGPSNPASPCPSNPTTSTPTTTTRASTGAPPPKRATSNSTPATTHHPERPTLRAASTGTRTGTPPVTTTATTSTRT